MSESECRNQIAAVIAARRIRGCDCSEGTCARHLADAILASPVLAQMKREWQAEAWADGYNAAVVKGLEAGGHDGHCGEPKCGPCSFAQARAEASGQEGEL